MIQKMTVSLALLLFLISAPAAAQMSIGYVNTQEVFSQMPERLEVQNQIEALLQKKQEEYENMRTEFEAAVNQFRADQEGENAGMSEEEFDRRNEELAQMQADIQQFPQVAQQEVEQERSRLLAPLFTRIGQAIQKVSEENGLDMVINSTTLTGDNILFYASESATDVTAMVVTEVTASQN